MKNIYKILENNHEEKVKIILGDGTRLEGFMISVDPPPTAYGNNFVDLQNANVEFQVREEQ